MVREKFPLQDDQLLSIVYPLPPDQQLTPVSYQRSKIVEFRRRQVSDQVGAHLFTSSIHGALQVHRFFESQQDLEPFVVVSLLKIARNYAHLKL